MSAAAQSSADPPSVPAVPDPVEELLVAYFERVDAEGSGVYAELAAAAPEHAAALRARLAALAAFEGAAAPSTPVPAAGTAGNLPRDFRPLRPLGRGAMGEVWLAEQLSLRRLVALKVLRLDGGSASSRERFRREAAALAKLRHPHVVAVYAAGEEDGTAWIAMEPVLGRGLDEILDEAAAEGRLVPHAQAAGWALDVAAGLAAAHAAGIVHRDVKPANVRIRPDTGRAVLLDFGLARDSERSALSVAGGFVGSPAYAAPEQTTGAETVGPPADVHGLGATLYRALTGALPYEGDSTTGVLLNVLTRDPRPPSAANPAVNRDLETIVLKCLEKAPAARYRDGAALAEDLRRYLDHRPILARPVGPLGRLRRQIRRRPGRAVAAFLFAALLIGGGVAFRRQELRAIKDLRAESDRARAAERDATAGFARADDLVRFMNDELYARLREIGRLDALDPIVRRTRSYYDELPPAFAARTSDTTRIRAGLNAGRVHTAAGDLVAAEAAFRRALVAAEAVRAAAPADAVDALDAVEAELRAELATGLARRGGAAEAEALLAQALAVARRRAAAAPADRGAILALAEVLECSADAAVRRDALAEARERRAEAARALDALCERNSADLEAARLAGRAYAGLAAVDFHMGAVPDAETAADRAVVALDRAAASRPFDPELTSSLASALTISAGVRMTLGRADLGAERLGRARAAREQLAAHDPTNLTRRKQFAEALLAEAGPLLGRGDDAGALAALRRAETQVLALVERAPEQRDWRGRATMTGIQIATILVRTGDAAAADYLHGLVARADEGRFLDDAPAFGKRKFAEILSYVGRLASGRGDTAAAAAAHRRALEILDAVAATAARDQDVVLLRAAECSRLGLALAAGARNEPARAEARKTLERALELLEETPEDAPRTGIDATPSDAALEEALRGLSPQGG
jgi:tetratricopeptide (TPR) repeat protein/predicted Ser/Thr protein kinase